MMWTSRLPELYEGHEPQDVWNADETGLFYRALPDCSMVLKGDTCKGTKISKDRMPVLLACSASSEKLKPLVIGHSERPRCFENYSIQSFGIDDKFNKKAWMTGLFW